MIKVTENKPIIHSTLEPYLIVYVGIFMYICNVLHQYQSHLIQLTMLIDLKGNAVASFHKICISTHKKDKFLTKTPRLMWTDNIELAYCYENIPEAIEFEDQEYIQDFIGSELQLLIWTDTRKNVYDSN